MIKYLSIILLPLLIIANVQARVFNWGVGFHTGFHSNTNPTKGLRTYGYGHDGVSIFADIKPRKLRYGSVFEADYHTTTITYSNRGAESVFISFENTSINLSSRVYSNIARSNLRVEGGLQFEVFNMITSYIVTAGRWTEDSWKKNFWKDFGKRPEITSVSKFIPSVVVSFGYNIGIVALGYIVSAQISPLFFYPQPVLEGTFEINPRFVSTSLYLKVYYNALAEKIKQKKAKQVE